MQLKFLIMMTRPQNITVAFQLLKKWAAKGSAVIVLMEIKF